MTAEEFISQLVEDGIASQPWMESTFENDFILLSEFSELEGPKPIFTIPADANARFNLNTFAVRVMSVDCVSIMQATDFSSFNIAGDIQVVLTELSEGAVAFVHHFVLYDIRARGFVRPFCLAYVTKNYGDLMAMFNELLHFFSTVASLYHFGNSISFINDLTLRMQHLAHLKTVLQDKSCDIFVEDKILSDSQKKGITAQALDEAMLQMHELIKTFDDYLKKDMFEDHRNVFADRYNELVKTQEATENHHFFHDAADGEDCTGITVNQNNCEGAAADKDLVSVQVISSENIYQKEYTDGDIECSDIDDGILMNARPAHKIPADVMSSILGKKYDKPLRSLNELCDSTFKQGLDVLKYCLHCLSNDTYTDLASSDALAHSSKFRFGCYEIPVISSLITGKCCTLDSPPPLPIRNLFSLCTSDESKCEPKEISPTRDIIWDNMNSSFLSTLKRTTISSPVLRTMSVTDFNAKGSNRIDSYVNIPSMASTCTKESYIILESPPSGIRSGNLSEGSSDSFKDALESFYPASSKSSTPDSSSGKFVYSRSVSVLSGDSFSPELTDSFKFSQISLLSLRSKYSFLQHAVYSFMIGRPLIIIAEERHRKSVKYLVNGLGNFLLQNYFTGRKIIPWMTNQLHLSDIGTVSLVGMLKGKVNTVQNSLKPYVSILDYEKQTLVAPQYTGSFLTGIFDPRKSFKSEAAYRHYIQQTLSEISNIVYVQFTSLYMQSGKYNDTSFYEQRLYNTTQENMGRVVLNDSLLVIELVNKLMGQVVTACRQHESELEIMLGKSKSRIKLNNLKCTTFLNSYKKKQ